MDGLLDFSFNVHRLLVKDFDPPLSRSHGWLWTGVPRLLMLFVFGVHSVSLRR